jgi:hypothetical protein
MNRVCLLPYYRFEQDSIPVLEVCSRREQEHKEMGWQVAVRLPYRYQPGKLEVGVFLGALVCYLDEEAEEGGYAIAEDLPFYITKNPKQLRVRIPSYTNQKIEGWENPLDLPLQRKKAPSRWEVSFDYLDSRYNEAIAAGWYPAIRID